jgi:SAM-dependent methyltransferase
MRSEWWVTRIKRNCPSPYRNLKEDAMAQPIPSEWTGSRGRIGAWYLNSRFRRLSETLLWGDLKSAFMKELSAILRGDEVVLDVGAGSGYFSLPVAKQLDRGKMICLDLSEEMLHRLGRMAEKSGVRDRIEILKGNASSLQLDKESVDLAVSHGVFHELSNPEAVLREMLRVLKPEGWVVVTDFRDTWIGNRVGAAHRDEDHGPFSVGELEFLFGKVGLNRIDVKPIKHWVMGIGQK